MNKLVVDLDTFIREDNNEFLRDKDSYTVRCPMCNEVITQEMTCCAGCNLPVEWKNSRVYKKASSSKRENTRSKIIALLLMAHAANDKFFVDSSFGKDISELLTTL